MVTPHQINRRRNSNTSKGKKNNLTQALLISWISPTEC